MKHNTRNRAALTLGAAVVFATLAAAPLTCAPAFAQDQAAQARPTAGENPVVADFTARVKEYTAMREKLEAEKLPKLSKDARPEEIEKHKASFQELVRAARAGAKQGNLFTADSARYLRALLRRELSGRAGREMRQTILEGETKGVPVRVNHPYPESKELVEVPAALLQKLPTLPKQVRYRFVGRNMLIVDRENGLIIDYLPNALR